MELNTVDEKFIESFRNLKNNTVIKMKNSTEEFYMVEKNIEEICNILHKEEIDFQDEADVIYYLDEMENIIGLKNYLSGYKPIIIQHIAYKLNSKF